MSASSSLNRSTLQAISSMALEEIARPSVPGVKTQKKSKKGTDTKWDHRIETLRREKLFRNPPRDHSAYPFLQEAIKPHTDSFNALFEGSHLIREAIRDIGTKVFLEPSRRNAGADPARNNRLHIRILDVRLERPSQQPKQTSRAVYPAECRERHATYYGRLTAKVAVRVNDGSETLLDSDLGSLPIMLRTNRCSLEGLAPAELVRRKEESDELGGYFIVNGNEKLIRMLALGKSNYPMAISRESFTDRGKKFSKYGIQMRCVRPDMTSQTNVLHYRKNGDVVFRFTWKKREYLIPVIMVLMALTETNLEEIYKEIVGERPSTDSSHSKSSKKTQSKSSGKESSEGNRATFTMTATEQLLRIYITRFKHTYAKDYDSYRLHNRHGTRSYLGQQFRRALGMPDDISDYAVGTEFLRKIVLVHLGNVDVTEKQDQDKFDMLLLMIRKLYALASGSCSEDNPDAVSNQDVLLGGFLYGMILKEKIEECLDGLTAALSRWVRMASYVNFTHHNFVEAFNRFILSRNTERVASALTYFLSTGNLSSQSGLDLQQESGFTVVAEKINFYRFISHFRMVHRGSFFAQLRTTTVRKLLPESWGFLCPVHTPDGSPCGLLNHLAYKCKILTEPSDASRIESLLAELGLEALKKPTYKGGRIDQADVREPHPVFKEGLVPVTLDGRLLGFCRSDATQKMVTKLRKWKVAGKRDVPRELEIGYVPTSNGGLYPGVFISSKAARMIRPVKYIPLQGDDFVGPFEQPFMSIACREHEIEEGESTHVEHDVKNILSILANQTPFSDHNQSPRNMYQCQMAKQTMGTFGTAIRHRTDNKAYQLTTGQTPIVRAPLYNAYGLDNFPNGTNAVVAVISYTGYDMDDAMIINKSAHERGFAHGTVYKTELVTLDPSGSNRGAKSITSLFGFAPGAAVAPHILDKLDEDGLPRIGVKLQQGDPLCASHSVAYDQKEKVFVNTDRHSNIHKYKKAEVAFVEEVRVIGSDSGTQPCQALSIKLRIPRSPVIGDKFSSRHGQKGVCSQKWPTADMPFSESGIVPDVIINPHAFPSRMTIGMFVESLAGKAGALRGIAQDSSPWLFNDDRPAGEHFGEQLREAGFNYHGNEPMYSGITGREFAADIYLGVVFYQRLRHMVNDKFQVRSTGPVNPLTNQPMKGRSRGGGIRVGEMERDALLAHGAAYLLQDRLLNCSDYSRAWICRACGLFLGTQVSARKAGASSRKRDAIASAAVRCRVCATRVDPLTPMAWSDAQGQHFSGGDDVTTVAVPGILKYLDQELLAAGVKMKFHVTL